MWQPGRGPFVVAVTDHALRDLSNLAPTCSSLLELESVADRVRQFIQAGHAPHLAETPAVLA
jgi:fumarylacetoacetate (FAA) hydrolase family protein